MNRRFKRLFNFAKSRVGLFAVLTILTTPISIYAFGYIASQARRNYLSLPIGSTTEEAEHIIYGSGFVLNVLCSPPFLTLLAVMALVLIMLPKSVASDHADPLADSEPGVVRLLIYAIIILIIGMVYLLVQFEAREYLNIFFKTWPEQDTWFHKLLLSHWEIKTFFLVALLCAIVIQIFLLSSLTGRIRSAATLSLSIIIAAELSMYPWIYALIEITTTKIHPVRIAVVHCSNAVNGDSWLLWSGRSEIAVLSIDEDSKTRTISIINRKELLNLDIIDTQVRLFDLAKGQRHPNSR